MKVAVTGATGLLGRHLVPALRGAGHEVRALVRPRPDRTPPADGGVTWVEGDLCDEGALMELTDGVDAILHAAYAEDESTFVRANVVGTLRLLERCGSTRARQFVYTSTLAVYGHDPGRDPRGERYERDEDFPVWPPELYGAHKAALEKMVSAAASTFGWNASAFRLGWVLGRQDVWEKNAFALTIDEALEHGRIRTARGGYVLAVEDAAAILAGAVGDEQLAGTVLNTFDRWYDFAEAAEPLSELLGRPVGRPSPCAELANPIRADRLRARGALFQTEERVKGLLEELLRQRGALE